MTTAGESGIRSFLIHQFSCRNAGAVIIVAVELMSSVYIGTATWIRVLAGGVSGDCGRRFGFLDGG